MSDRLSDFPVTFHNRQYAPLMVGGMGVNISNDTLALAVEKLGGIAHLSDALLMDIADKQFGTSFCKDKIHRFKNLIDSYDKSEIVFDLERLAESTRRYVSDVMRRKTGRGLILINCMEKLTMNASTATLKTRLNAALDGGIDGITLSAGLHLSSMKLMQDNPRFHEALIGIVVSSTRALQIFMKRAQAVGATARLRCGRRTSSRADTWALAMTGPNTTSKISCSDVVKWIGDNGFDIPVFAAGGIFSGEDAVHFVRDVGAAGVQVATRFAVAQESGLPEAVKQRYIDATDDDVQVNHFSTTGYPMRMLKDSPAITSDIRPNCEAYGYLLQKGECSYVKEWFARHGKIDIQPVPEHSKCCLCTHMRNFKVWTCGASVSRLKNVTKRRPDGSCSFPLLRKYGAITWKRNASICPRPPEALAFRRTGEGFWVEQSRIGYYPSHTPADRFCSF